MQNSSLPVMLETELGFAPEAPANVEATGISRSLLLDLALKLAHVMPQISTESAAGALHLPQVLTAGLLEQLRTEQLIEALGKEGFGFRYSITQRGRDRAARLLEISGYIGPAPVSLAAYQDMLQWQMEKAPVVPPDRVREVLADLVLPDEAVRVAGLALSSGRSLFLSGPPGNGKTSVGHQLHRALEGEIWIPHCIAVDNAIIRVFDPQCHEMVEHGPGKHKLLDRRWVKIRRPFIVAGGEMTLASLDLAYLPASRYYEAPLHMKANGGMFLIDDFGRQHVEPHELLNRWIIPLEHRIDFLTLHTGQKIQVPFLMMLVIATNLNPKDVTDPAFLRRIGYRLQVPAPTREVYGDIFRRYAQRYGLKAEDALLEWLMQRYTAKGRELRACEPRDLIERVCDICRHHGYAPRLDQSLLEQAWDGYFGMEN
ncbi:MAG: ATP-binding protein [Proteobacteria bacterium]|nr:ATP-binding protein [Pseudomonadota bacterium]